MNIFEEIRNLIAFIKLSKIAEGVDCFQIQSFVEMGDKTQASVFTSKTEENITELEQFTKNILHNILNKLGIIPVEIEKQYCTIFISRKAIYILVEHVHKI